MLIIVNKISFKGNFYLYLIFPKIETKIVNSFIK